MGEISFSIGLNDVQPLGLICRLKKAQAIYEGYKRWCQNIDLLQKSFRTADGILMEENSSRFVESKGSKINVAQMMCRPANYQAAHIPDGMLQDYLSHHKGFVFNLLL